LPLEAAAPLVVEGADDHPLPEEAGPFVQFREARLSQGRRPAPPGERPDLRLDDSAEKTLGAPGDLAEESDGLLGSPALGGEKPGPEEGHHRACLEIAAQLGTGWLGNGGACGGPHQDRGGLQGVPIETPRLEEEEVVLLGIETLEYRGSNGVIERESGWGRWT
jgi:hypothetical protein